MLVWQSYNSLKRMLPIFMTLGTLRQQKLPTLLQAMAI